MAGDGSIVAVVALAFTGIIAAVVAMVAQTMSPERKRIGRNSAKFPAAFTSSLTRKEVLDAVEQRLTNIPSLRQKWKTTDKVEKVGRYQAMLKVPYNLAGDNIMVSFLLNLLATSKEAGGCTVEWSYVMMSQLSDNMTQIAVIEQEVYKNTTLEIRSAIFTAQGDAEEAEFLESKTEQQQHDSTALEQLTDEATLTAQPAKRQESFPPLPDIVGEELKYISGTTGNPALMQVPEVQAQMPSVDTLIPEVQSQMPTYTLNTPLSDTKLGDVSNTLNFTPPDPNLSSSAPKQKELKCAKCNQDRDPSFNFCLYCGHTD